MIPLKLFKYKAFDRNSLSMLINKEIYFAPPEELNDPYDCQIDINQSLNVAIGMAPTEIKKELAKYLQAQDLLQRINSDAKAAGIFSLSGKPLDMKMWTHYASNHTGFCIGFQLSDYFLKYNEKEKIIGTSPVYYSKSNPFIDFFGKIAVNPEKPKYEEFWATLLNLSLIAKSETWLEEEECRITRAEPGLVSFSPSEIKEITFGAHMSIEDRKTIKNIVSGVAWEHIEFYEVSNDLSSFDIKKKPL
jgi:hypothetical protein